MNPVTPAVIDSLRGMNEPASTGTKGMLSGSFDPITKGHLDVLVRGAKLLGDVCIVVTHNPAKRGLFDIAERLELVRASLREWDAANGTHLATTVPIHEVTHGLLADFAAEHGIAYNIRGLRTGADFEYERPMAVMNHHLSGLETVFFTADSRWSAVSSSLIKEVASLGGDISEFVPDAVAQALRRQGKPGGDTA